LRCKFRGYFLAAKTKCYIFKTYKNDFLGGGVMDLFNLDSYKAEESMNAFDKSEELINEYLTLLKEGYCLQIGFSGGKDSTCILNGAIEAMARGIKAGVIEKERPLVVITVDTLLEPAPIQCYLPFAHKQVSIKAAESDINLFIKTISPPIQDQLMTLFAGAQKLLATASSGRSADCSKIWKIDLGVKELRLIKSSLPVRYQRSSWISVSGSRSSESPRRKNNMLNQNVLSVQAQKLIENIKVAEQSVKGNVFRFAPIGHWSSADVISYLTHAGNAPMVRPVPGCVISSYGQNFGLLLAIYGESSGSDVCDVAIIDDANKSETSGCGNGRVARFGCVTCTLVAEDKTAKESFEYPRWSRFGDSTLRLRDYLSRVSDDITLRSFHARAYDNSANNNVFLQPNSLRSRVLEKMVWYASQISLDYQKIHIEFKNLHERNELGLDVGIQDIMNDITLTESVKNQYIDCYTSRMLEGPLYTLFSKEHAVLLSFLWALHGVASQPYQPVSIYDSVFNKGKSIPFPPTNAELNAKRQLQGLPTISEELKRQRLPDAVVARLFTPVSSTYSELKSKLGGSLKASDLREFMPFQIDDYWQIKNIQFDALGGVVNYPVTRSLFTRKFNLSYNITGTGQEEVKAKCLATKKQIKLVQGSTLYNELLDLGRQDYALELEHASNEEGVSIEEMEAFRKEQNSSFGIQSTHEFSNQAIYTSSVTYFDKSAKKTKKQPLKCWSARKRVFDKAAGKYVAGRSSLKTYTASIKTSLSNQLEQTVSYWVPDDSVEKVCLIGTHQSERDFEIKNGINFDSDVFEYWKDYGWDQLLKLHEQSLRKCIRNKLPLRKFMGTAPVYHLTNNTGLSISEKLVHFLHKTLKRTELFDKAGLYDLANLSEKRLLSIPTLISMSEHRSQKAQHLLAVRHVRHLQNSHIKTDFINVACAELQNKQVYKNISQRLHDFTLQFESIANAYLASDFLGLFATNSNERRKKYEIWLSEFAPVLSTVDAMLTVLATKAEMKLVDMDFELKQLLVMDLEQKTSELKQSLIKSVPVEAVESIIDQVKQGGAIIHTQGTQYIPTVNISKNIDVICGWIKSNYSKTNAFLLAHGFTTSIAYMVNQDYINPVFTVKPSTNSDEKKLTRRVAAELHWAKGLNKLDLKSHDCLSPLFTSVGVEVLKRVATKKQDNKLISMQISRLFSAGGTAEAA
jgi:3'-phosphoadenosine 5'-phosphosulfate sulfotransferase (PAPS reductase)/FAD synthetase